MSLRERLKKTHVTPDASNQPGPAGHVNENYSQATQSDNPLSQTYEQKTAHAKGERFEELKTIIHGRLVDNVNFNPAEQPNIEEISFIANQFLEQFLISERIPMSRTERDTLVRELVEEILGYGPIEPLLKDPSVSEIMINGPKSIYVERNGKIFRTTVLFKDNAHLMHIIERIVSAVGRRVDEKTPMVDARLKDGSRFNAIIPPLAIDGPSVTIRKFKQDAGTMEKLLAWGSMTPEMAKTLEAAVKSHMNIIISGGTGSGKTTLLNSLSTIISNDERIVTIEDSAELQLKQEHVVRLESRPSNIEGEGAISIRQLLINALRMRPDRIVVGECRSGETLDMLQAMNTGHDGSLTTLHANTPRDALSRIETMCMMNDNPLPERAIRQQISSAVHMIVQVSRLQDGTRRTTSITELTGMEGEVITMQEIFKFAQSGIDENGKVIGRHVATGVRPRFAEKARSKGINLPNEIFLAPDDNAAATSETSVSSGTAFTAPGAAVPGEDAQSIRDIIRKRNTAP